MRRPLGKGLSALLSESSEEYNQLDAGQEHQLLPIGKIVPNPNQPRQFYDEEALNELAESIKAKGVLQPILVRPNPRREDTWEVVAGERRWRASGLAGLENIPCLVRTLTDSEALEITMLENIQRQDLTPIEEARGYRDLQERFDHSQESLARIIHKSRSHIANTLRLLQLPPTVQEHIEQKQLSAGHAKVLVGQVNAEAIALRTIKEKWSVRQLEEYLQKNTLRAMNPDTHGNTRIRKLPEIVQLEEEIHHHLGLPVRITSRDGHGTVTLHYRNLEELQALIDKLTS